MSTPLPHSAGDPSAAARRTPGRFRVRLRRRGSALHWNIQTFIVPTVLVALWGVLLLALYQWNARNEAAHVRELALLQARAFFSQIVSTRAWNAAHGGVFVRTSELGQPNPGLPPGQRTLLAADGTLLTLMNPAYMTRQISEFLTTSQGVSFRITSLHPLRPENGADPWEAESLRAFNAGEGETFTLSAGGAPSDVRHEPSFRYMAPLLADQSCLGCHRTADDTMGGLRGGISVSIAAAPLLALEQQRLGQTGMAYAIIGVAGLLGIGGASLQVSRKKALAEAANRMKSAFLANMSHDMRTPLTGIIGMAELLSAFQPGRDAAAAERENPLPEKLPAPTGPPPAEPPPGDGAPRAGRRIRYNEYLGQLRCAAANLLEIVNDITDFSCLESERMRLAPRTFRLRPALESCLGLFRFAGERKGLSLLLHVAGDVPDGLLGDDFRLRQALGNLIGNAVKFTHAGSITVRVHLAPDPAPPRSATRHVLLRCAVADTGVGIPTDQQEAIFESFVQGDAASSLCLGGTGLGLAISREIARMMGGDIGVSSTPGQGSEFWFTARFAVAEPLPHDIPDSRSPRGVHPAGGAGAIGKRHVTPEAHGPSDHDRDIPAGQDNSPDQGAPPGQAGKTGQPGGVGQAKKTVAPPLRLLVADDNPVNRLFMRDVLRSAGHQAVVAVDGVQALRLLEEWRPDLALLDVRMPGCDGIEVVRRLRAGRVPGVAPDMPVLAVTASAVGSESAALLGAGMTGCVCKPLTAAVLLAAVADAAAGGTPLECPGAPGYADGVHRWRDGGASADALVEVSARPPAAPPAALSGSTFQSGGANAPSGRELPGEPDTLTDSMDEPAALEALGGNRTLFLKLCLAFLDEVDARHAALTRAVREERRQDALREAHALRNSAGTLRLPALHGLCAAMEKAAGGFAAAPDSRLDDLLRQLTPILETSIARVRAVVGASGTPHTATPGTSPEKEAPR